MQGVAGAALRCSHLAPAVRTRRAAASVRCKARAGCSGAAERKETARSAVRDASQRSVPLFRLTCLCTVFAVARHALLSARRGAGCQRGAARRLCCAGACRTAYPGAQQRQSLRRPPCTARTREYASAAPGPVGGGQPSERPQDGCGGKRAHAYAPRSSHAAHSQRPRPQVLLIVFIIIQGPKGEGMINSLNGAGRIAAEGVLLAASEAYLRREPHAGKLLADEELRDCRHLGTGGRLPDAVCGGCAQALMTPTALCCCVT